MGAITIRLSDELSSCLDEEAEVQGYPDAAAFAQAMLESEHERRTAALHALLEEGLASGFVEGDGLEAFDRAVERAREDFRSRGRESPPMPRRMSSRSGRLPAHAGERIEPTTM